MARLNLLEETRYEKLPVTVYPNQKVAAVAVAKRIADLIRSKNDRGEQTVLVPVLGDRYGEVVDRHEIAIRRDGG